MTRNEYIDLFHKAQVNLVAFKQIFHCDEELRKMVEIALADEREACAVIGDSMDPLQDGDIGKAIRARGENT